MSPSSRVPEIMRARIDRRKTDRDIAAEFQRQRAELHNAKLELKSLKRQYDLADFERRLYHDALVNWGRETLESRDATIAKLITVSAAQSYVVLERLHDSPEYGEGPGASVADAGCDRHPTNRDNSKEPEVST